jgi:hypothetical protein
MTKQSTLGLGMVTAGIAVALAAFLLFASQAFAAGTVVASSTEAEPGGSATVTLTANAGTGHGVGNYTLDLTYDPLDFSGDPENCTSNAAGSFTVNPGGASGIVRFAGATGQPTGLTGDVVIGTCDFTPVGDAGDCVEVGAAIGRMDDENGNDLGATASGTDVCIAEAVTDAPTDSASPTPTKAQPSGPSNTGGPQGDNGMSSLTWLLGITGLAIVAAGAWTLSRARREN